MQILKRVNVLSVLRYASLADKSLFSREHGIIIKKLIIVLIAIHFHTTCPHDRFETQTHIAVLDNPVKNIYDDIKIQKLTAEKKYKIVQPIPMEI